MYRVLTLPSLESCLLRDFNSSIKARIDNLIHEKYDSKNWNFPLGITLARYIHETIEHRYFM